MFKQMKMTTCFYSLFYLIISTIIKGWNFFYYSNPLLNVSYTFVFFLYIVLIAALVIIVFWPVLTENIKYAFYA